MTRLNGHGENNMEKNCNIICTPAPVGGLSDSPEVLWDFVFISMFGLILIPVLGTALVKLIK